jgi:parallel beta-helix repeat protein
MISRHLVEHRDAASTSRKHIGHTSFVLISGWLLCVASLIVFTPRARADVYEVHDGEDLFSVLEGLVAGDEVIVHDGVYHTPGYVMLTLNGTSGAPIVVRAAAGAQPQIVGDPSQNVINIEGHDFVFSGFELTGGSHGLRLYNVHDAILENLEIHDTDEVALSANIPGDEYYNITFRRLELHHTGGHGEGMYLGCNHGECTFRENLIEFCHIHHTNEGVSQGDGIEIKQGSWGNIVRNNVIHDTQYPCIIVYGSAGNTANLIEHNVMWNCADSGIQAAADAIIRNNIILSSGNGINSHEHQEAVPGNLTIINNTVVACSDRCLRASDWSGSSGILVANNAFYCDGGGGVRIADGGADITFHHNIVMGTVEGVGQGYSEGNGSQQDFVDHVQLNVWPTQGSPLIDSGDPATAPAVDYNWNIRDQAPDVGAYEWQSGGNPGWTIGESFRPYLDGGVSDPDGSTGNEDGATLADGEVESDAASAVDGALNADAVGTADASPDSDSAKGDSGCGCRSTIPSGCPIAFWVLIFFCGLACIFRRRARQRHCTRQRC